MQPIRSPIPFAIAINCDTTLSPKELAIIRAGIDIYNLNMADNRIVNLAKNYFESLNATEKSEVFLWKAKVSIGQQNSSQAQQYLQMGLKFDPKHFLLNFCLKRITVDTSKSANSPNTLWEELTKQAKRNATEADIITPQKTEEESPEKRFKSK